MQPVQVRKIADDCFEISVHGNCVGRAKSEDEAKEIQDKEIEKLWASEETLPGDGE